MANLKITLVKSTIGALKDQQRGAHERRRHSAGPVDQRLHHPPAGIDSLVPDSDGYL